MQQHRLIVISLIIRYCTVIVFTLALKQQRREQQRPNPIHLFRTDPLVPTYEPHHPLTSVKISCTTLQSMAMRAQQRHRPTSIVASITTIPIQILTIIRSSI